jgi:murein DD-endopeptidase MepM/ murein hydrolase activator NlpD
VADTYEYKKLKDIPPVVFNTLASALKSVINSLTQRWTIVLVPHSEKKVYNVHINIFSILCFVFSFIGLIGVLLWYASFSRVDDRHFSERDSKLSDTQASLDQLRDEVSLFLKEAKEFETALSSTFAIVGPNVHSRENTPISGDFSSFFDVREVPENQLPEVNEMRRLGDFLQRSIESIQEIGTILDSQSALLTEIPSIWPIIKGAAAHISFSFGQQIHPFTGLYYIHKGIDLSTYRQGDPIVATADGQVVTVDFDAGGFGHNVIIKHKYGFYTRYAHMLSMTVKVGDRVQQGQTIGYIGNTGLSTGPHLHYEVHIGSDVVDPIKYLSIKTNLTRR